MLALRHEDDLVPAGGCIPIHILILRCTFNCIGVANCMIVWAKFAPRDHYAICMLGFANIYTMHEERRPFLFSLKPNLKLDSRQALDARKVS